MVLGTEDYQALRAAVYERDGGICQITGIRLLTSNFSLDHVKKCKMGGGFRDDTMANVRLAHPVANQLREDGKTPEEIKAIMRRAGIR